MNTNKLLIYLTVLAFGFIVSFFVIRAGFDIKNIGALIFLLIFIPALINPDIGFIIIIVSMLFSPAVSVGMTTGREVVVRIEDIFLLVLILAWLIKAALTKNIINVFKTDMTVPFFSYIAICSISTTVAVLFQSGIDAKKGFFCILKYLEYFLLFLMVRSNLKSMRQSKIFIVVFLLTAIFVAAHSNVFIEKRLEAGTAFFRTTPPVEKKQESGTLAGYLLFMIGVAAGLLLYTSSVPLRVFLIGIQALMFRALLYTLSRGTYLAFIPMTIALMYFTKRNKLLVLYIIFALTALFVVFMPEMVRNRVLTTISFKEDISGTRVEWEESPRARLESWSAISFNLFPKSPLLGHGAGRYFTDGQLFLTLSESGLLGLILLFWILARLFKMANKVPNIELVKNDDFSMGISIGFIIGFVGLLAQAFSTNTFIIVKIMEPFWFIAAIVLMLPELLKAEEEKRSAITA